MADQRFTVDGDVFEEKRPSAFELAATLGSRLGDVFAALEVLDTRLAPVLGLPVPRPGGPTDIEESSPLVTEIRRAIAGIEEMRVTINLLTSRLEV